MELLFLGTGAGELFPSAFCDCDACTQAVQERGRQARIGSCLLIDRSYLIDVPPNLGLAAVQCGVSLAKVTHIFVTHSHQDHFDPCVLAVTRRGSSSPLRIFCNERTSELLAVYRQFNRFFDPQKLNLEISVIEPFDTVCEGDGDIVVTALLADHDTTGGEKPLIFIFERDEKTVLYACDTGWFPEKTWREIERHRYDAVVLDCTFHEIRECRRGHLSFEPFVELKKRFESYSLLKNGAKFIAQHISHKHSDNDPSHEALKEKFLGHGVDLAYDGMVVEI